jgi:hypothetical protein
MAVRAGDPRVHIGDDIRTLKRGLRTRAGRASLTRGASCGARGAGTASVAVSAAADSLACATHPLALQQTILLLTLLTPLRAEQLLATMRYAGAVADAEPMSAVVSELEAVADAAEAAAAAAAAAAEAVKSPASLYLSSQSFTPVFTVSTHLLSCFGPGSYAMMQMQFGNDVWG